MKDGGKLGTCNCAEIEVEGPTCAPLWGICVYKLVYFQMGDPEEFKPIFADHWQQPQ